MLCKQCNHDYQNHTFSYDKETDEVVAHCPECNNRECIRRKL